MHSESELSEYRTVCPNTVLHVRITYCVYEYRTACPNTVLHVRIPYCVYEYRTACSNILWWFSVAVSYQHWFTKPTATLWKVCYFLFNKSRSIQIQVQIYLFPLWTWQKTVGGRPWPSERVPGSVRLTILVINESGSQDIDCRKARGAYIGSSLKNVGHSPYLRRRWYRISAASLLLLRNCEEDDIRELKLLVQNLCIN